MGWAKAKARDDIYSELEMPEGHKNIHRTETKHLRNLLFLSISRKVLTNENDESTGKRKY